MEGNESSTSKTKKKREGNIERNKRMLNEPRKNNSVGIAKNARIDVYFKGCAELFLQIIWFAVPFFLHIGLDWMGWFESQLEIEDWAPHVLFFCYQQGSRCFCSKSVFYCATKRCVWKLGCRCLVSATKVKRNHIQISIFFSATDSPLFKRAQYACSNW